MGKVIPIERLEGSIAVAAGESGHVAEVTGHLRAQYWHGVQRF